jgi:hypothetical protein
VFDGNFNHYIVTNTQLGGKYKQKIENKNTWFIVSVEHYPKSQKWKYTELSRSNEIFIFPSYI